MTKTETATFRVTMKKGNAQRKYVGVSATCAANAERAAKAAEVHGFRVVSVCLEANRPIDINA